MTTTQIDPQVPENTQPPRQPKPKHSRRFRLVRAGLVIVSALAVLGGIGAAAGSHDTAAVTPKASTSAPAIQGIQGIPPGVAAPAKATPKPAAKVAPKPAVTVTAKAAPAPTVTVKAPAAAATTAAPAPATPAVTAAQAQALQSAQGYLSDGQGFSRAGLIAQLDSPYGGQFSVGDATWAADHSGADWDAQAVIAAKGYLSDGQGFSRSGLIAQLDSPYGGQFTAAQAAYAAGQAGL